MRTRVKSEPAVHDRSQAATDVLLSRVLRGKRPYSILRKVQRQVVTRHDRVQSLFLFVRNACYLTYMYL